MAAMADHNVCGRGNIGSLRDLAHALRQIGHTDAEAQAITHAQTGRDRRRVSEAVIVEYDGHLRPPSPRAPPKA